VRERGVFRGGWGGGGGRVGGWKDVQSCTQIGRSFQNSSLTSITGP
jgi:hypothetical protein